VYLVRCADASLYCGITNKLEARMTAHNAGKGAKYTRSRGPVKLVWFSRHRSKGKALQIEYATKCLTRSEKEHLVACTGLPPLPRKPGLGITFKK